MGNGNNKADSMAIFGGGFEATQASRLGSISQGQRSASKSFERIVARDSASTKGSQLDSKSGDKSLAQAQLLCGEV